MKIKQNLTMLGLAVSLALTLIHTFAGERLPAAQAAPAAPVAGVIYVDRDATGANDGSSWANAYTHLQDALNAADSGDEIWVAEGVYARTDTTNRAATFYVKSGVALYGGFVGVESERDARDPQAHVTVLSGDLGRDDVMDANGVVTDTANIVGDNAYHVVTGSSVDESAVLDGFTVTAGNANSASSPGDCGGGMRNVNARPTLMNVSFKGNYANYGGGMYNKNSSPTLANVTFSDNSADYGGGMYNNDSNLKLANVSFNANYATGGGGMFNSGSNPTLSDVSFNANYATYGGGAWNYAASPKLSNVSFNGNTADGGGGGGMYNSNGSSPTLANVTFSGNNASYGGGIYNYESSPTLANVTFSDNSVSGNGGGMLNGTGSNPTLTNVTFDRNSASVSGVGGMYSYENNPTVHNTLFVKGATGDNCNDEAFASGSTHNLADDASCGDSTTQSVDINPGTLGDYGGDTQTVPLLPGSDAIDAGDAAHCPATDQRGAGRVSTCDIGAFEAQGFTLAMTGGDNQSAAITKPFPQPLQVIVASNATPADPVDGGTVTFTAPSSGASTNPSSYIATITDSKAGVSVTANGTAGGPYTVTAGTAGATAGVNFTLTNVAMFYLYLPWIEKN